MTEKETLDKIVEKLDKLSNNHRNTGYDMIKTVVVAIIISIIMGLFTFYVNQQKFVGYVDYRLRELKTEIEATQQQAKRDLQILKDDVNYNIQILAKKNGLTLKEIK